MAYFVREKLLMPRGGWIYMLTTNGAGTKNGRFKLGIARSDISRRFSALRTGDPDLSLHCAFFIPYSLHKDVRYLEKMLDERLDPTPGQFDYSDRLRFERIAFDSGGMSEWFLDPMWQGQKFVEEQIMDLLSAEITDDFTLMWQQSPSTIYMGYEADVFLAAGKPCPMTHHEWLAELQEMARDLNEWPISV